MKKNKILLNIVSVFCFIYGALYIFSLVFIPVGIYCFSAGKKFNYKADHLLDNYAIDKKVMRFYVIFVSICCFPFGLLAIIPYIGLYGNNVKVDGFEYTRVVDVGDIQNEVKNDEEGNLTENNDADKVNSNEETEEERYEKLAKLQNFRDKNIISEEEFEMAKEQLFGKDSKK